MSAWVASRSAPLYGTISDLEDSLTIVGNDVTIGRMWASAPTMNTLLGEVYRIFLRCYQHFAVSDIFPPYAGGRGERRQCVRGVFQCTFIPLRPVPQARPAGYAAFCARPDRSRLRVHGLYGDAYGPGGKGRREGRLYRGPAGLRLERGAAVEEGKDVFSGAIVGKR